MAFNGLLLKVGNYEIKADKYIQADSYLAYISVLDLDATRNAAGKLVRNALDHKPAKIDFTTPPNLTNTEYAELMSNIRANFTVAKERKANVTFYVPETDSYETQEMYMPDPQPKIYRIEKDTNTIHYEAIRIAFIGY